MLKLSTYFLAFVFVVLFLISCSTPKPCGELATAYGNLDGVFNTRYNEFSPHFFEDRLYFSVMPVGKNKKESVYYSLLVDTGFTKPKEATDLPLEKVKNAGAISLTKMEDKTMIFFAGTDPKSKTANRDIFFAEKIGKNWTEPKPIKEINSKHYESYPFISKDGTLLVFSSDRPNGIGGIDLYYSMLDEDGKWSEPINFGSLINSKENEISAFLDDNWNLYFASRGHNTLGGYDIYKSEYKGNYSWSEPKQLPFPINTEFNETGPSIKDNFLYLASDRKDGCGARDLYSFQLCSDVDVNGLITDEQNYYSPSGKLVVYDENEKIVKELKISDDGMFKVRLKGNSKYFLEYTNDCEPFYTPKTELVTPCDENNFLKIDITILLPSEPQNFEMGKYKIPFFVSGYYKPNVQENLNDLRNLFQMNLIGNDDSTRYIEYPSEIYDEYSFAVQDAFQQIIDKVVELSKIINNKCSKKTDRRISIEVVGYADPRGFSNFAKYYGPEIDDPIIPEKVQTGQKMSNELLSLLRAYFVQKHMETLISRLENGNEILKNIDWKVTAGGIAPSDDDLILQRKVNIKFGLK